MKKDTLAIIDQITRYFDVKIIGSYLFYIGGTLDFKDLNDIDIVVDSAENAVLVDRFLVDNGYTTEGNVYTKGDDLPIELMLKKDCELYPLHKIVAEKYRRKRTRDLITLQKIINKHLKDNKKIDKQ